MIDLLELAMALLATLFAGWFAIGAFQAAEEEREYRRSLWTRSSNDGR
jgi:hypothetical protein